MAVGCAKEATSCRRKGLNLASTSLGVMLNCISTRRIISSYDIGTPLEPIPGSATALVAECSYVL